MLRLINRGFGSLLYSTVTLKRGLTSPQLCDHLLHIYWMSTPSMRDLAFEQLKLAHIFKHLDHQPWLIQESGVGESRSIRLIN
jgi:hypothetical protein